MAASLLPEAVGKVGNIAGIIKAAISAGLSANRGLVTLREAGLGIRRQTFLDLWRATTQGLAQRAAIAGLDPSLPLPELVLSDWHAGQRGQWAYQVNVVVSNVFDPEGPLDVRPFTMVTDRLARPETAIGEALDEYGAAVEDATEEDTGFGEQIEGAVIVGIYRMVGRPR